MSHWATGTLPSKLGIIFCEKRVFFNVVRMVYYGYGCQCACVSPVRTGAEFLCGTWRCVGIHVSLGIGKCRKHNDRARGRNEQVTYSTLPRRLGHFSPQGHRTRKISSRNMLLRLEFGVTPFAGCQCNIHVPRQSSNPTRSFYNIVVTGFAHDDLDPGFPARF